MRHLISGLCLGLWALSASAHVPFAAETDGGDADHYHEALTPDAEAIERSGFARDRIEAFRESGDDRELQRAWRYLEQDLKQAAPAYDTLLTAAYVVQAQHHFAAAMRYLDRAQNIRALDDEALLLKASLHLLLAEIEPARAACRSVSVNQLHARLFCEGRVASTSAVTAMPAYQRLRPLVTQLGSRPGLAAWAHSVLGDLAAATGDTDAAIAHYETSLAHLDRAQVRAALVDQLMAVERWRDAWRYVQSPGHSLALHVRQFIVARAIGQEARVQHAVTQADQSFRRWMAQGDWLHAREMSRFYLDVMPRPYLANRLARINYMLQKESEDQRLVQRTL